MLKEAVLQGARNISKIYENQIDRKFELKFDFLTFYNLFLKISKVSTWFVDAWNVLWSIFLRLKSQICLQKLTVFPFSKNLKCSPSHRSRLRSSSSRGLLIIACVSVGKRGRNLANMLLENLHHQSRLSARTKTSPTLPSPPTSRREILNSKETLRLIPMFSFTVPDRWPQDLDIFLAHKR